MKKALKVIGIIVGIIAVIVIAMTISGQHHSKPENVKTYDTTNPYILEETDISQPMFLNLTFTSRKTMCSYFSTMTHWTEHQTVLKFSVKRM